MPFSDSNDPIDQKARFQKQVEMQERGDDEAGMMDTDYITALNTASQQGGLRGIGIDRRRASPHRTGDHPGGHFCSPP